METEEFGFRRSRFPLSFYGHSLLLVENKATLTTDGRLSIHLVLYCSSCEDERVVRGKLPVEQSSEEMVPYFKLLALGGFTELCDNHS